MDSRGVRRYIMSSRDYKEQVLAAVPIESYIGRYVPLKRAGKRLTGLCPFHSEKTPSFSVTPEKGLFYCFGCGKGGDLLRFVMDYEAVSFPEALETLGRFAGIEKPKNFSGRKNDPRERLYDLNERVARSFAQYLQSAEGRGQSEYLQSRGLTRETLEAFGLGGSPDSWEWLRQKYVDHEQDLVHLGLLKAGRQEGRPPYDFFRNRVIFPIRDGGGRYVAFGGRAMPGAEKQAKYINSPESSVFHKSQVLYGLYQGLSEIRSKGECFLVEGYMDVIGLHQAGYRTACAPLGTALTPEHLKLIARYTSNLTCIFDGDRAGRAAALKFARLSLEHGGLVPRVILLPAGRDPFDLALELPGPQLEELLGPELRIPAERFYLLEVMFPGRFAEQASGAMKPAADATIDGDMSPGEEMSGDHSEPGARDYALQAREYYAGRLTHALPRGTEKRPGLDRLFAELGELRRDSDRLLLLEEAAHLLGLNATEVRREWQQSPHAAAARYQRSRPSRPVPAAGRSGPASGVANPRRNSPEAPAAISRGPVPTPAGEGDAAREAPETRDYPEAERADLHPPEDGEGAAVANEPMDFGPDIPDFDGGANPADIIANSPGDAGDAPAPAAPRFADGPNRVSDATHRRRIACERALMIELFLAPAMVGAYQAGIAGLEFADPQAEFFWRYLETRYLTGNIWTLDDLSRFELPEETMQIFSAQILQRLEGGLGTPQPKADEGGEPSALDEEEVRAAERLQVTVINDLLLELRILDLKKKIADTGSRYVVADSVDQSYLIQESGRLVKELKELELQRRKSGQAVS